MIIQCVGCLKKFEVEDSQVPTLGRQVKCGVCSKEWFYKPEEVSSNNQEEQSPIGEQPNASLEKAAAEERDELSVENSDADEKKVEDVVDGHETTRIDFDDLENENEISKTEMDRTLDKISETRRADGEKRKSSLTRSRYLAYLLIPLILILFLVTIPYSENVLNIFPELGIVYEGMKPLYNFLFK
jgi:predicted Zn finger-like uncharacterized protein|tara:strand:+ start:922 stop:1479 length:558 start_codon:yes stop_codon:yes gene_type:complete